jgi:hypothetical protein
MGAADSYVAVDIDEADADIQLKIADCDRTVRLFFSYGKYDERTKAQARTKLRKLQYALALIEEALR